MKIISQIEINEVTVIEVSESTYFANYAVIENKGYPTDLYMIYQII